MEKLTFAEVLKRAPEIEVTFEGRTMILRPSNIDKLYAKQPVHGLDYVVGTGSEADPYRLKSASSISLHYCIVNLWWLLRPKTADREGWAYVHLNGCNIQFRHDGVVTLVSHERTEFPFFRLLPEEHDPYFKKL